MTKLGKLVATVKTVLCRDRGLEVRSYASENPACADTYNDDKWSSYEAL